MIDKTLPSPYTYNAKVLKVVDGDTVHLEVSKDFTVNIDFGFQQSEVLTISRKALVDCRLARINAPELSTQAGKDAKVAITTFLGLGMVTARIYKQDKYGRWLVDLDVLIPPSATPVLGLQPGTTFNVNDQMVTGGYAVPFMVDG